MTQHDIGALIKGAHAGAADATAGGTGDATEVSGPWIDRTGYMSAKLIVTYKAVLAQTKTLSIAANLQDADDDQAANAGDYGDAYANAVVATGETGGSTETGVVEIDFDLAGAKQYVRAQFTPDLNASGTDTAIVAAVLVLGGSDTIPAA